MNCNKSKKEKKSDSRRSSILKRQDTCRIENFESDGPRTPRRVSFASTCTVKHFNPLPWHSSSDESSSTNHEAFSLMVDSDEVFQSMHTSSFPQPSLSTGSQLEECGERLPQTQDEQLANAGHAKERESQPMQNTTIIFSDMNESGCAMETTANISELSSSFGESVSDKNYIIIEEKQEMFSKSIHHTIVSEVKQPKILDNLFSLIKKSKTVENSFDNPEEVACSKLNSAHTQGLLKSGNRSAFHEISEFDVMTPIEELSLASTTNQSLGEFKKGLCVQPVSSQVFNSSQVSLKQDKIEKFIIDKENIRDCDKENYPMLATLNTSQKTLEIVPQNIKKVSTVEITRCETNSNVEHYRRFTGSTIHFQTSEGMEISTELSRTVQIDLDGQKTHQTDALFGDESKTIYFGPQADHSDLSDDMELTNVLTKTFHLGLPPCANTAKNVEMSTHTVHFGHQQLIDGCDLLPGSGDMELTSGLAKTIYIGPDCKNMESSIQANSLCRDASETIHFGLQGHNSEDDNMELTNVLTKTSHTGFSSCANAAKNVEISTHTVHFGRQQLIEGCDLLPDSGDMELTSGLAKTIYIGPDCKNVESSIQANSLCRDASKTTHFGPQANNSEDDDMELTNVLTKTSHIGFSSCANAAKNVEISTHTVHFGRQQLIEGCDLLPDSGDMELTSGLAKTIYIGPDCKNVESSIQANSLCRDASKTIHFGPQANNSEDDDMELTNVLTKTSHIGFSSCANAAKNVEISTHTVHFGRQQLIEGCDLLPDSGDMELTSGLAKTIYIGPDCKNLESSIQANSLCRDASKTIHFGSQANNSEDDDMELTNVLTKTSHIGFSSCANAAKNVEISTHTVHFGHQQLIEGCDLLSQSGDMELTTGLAKTINVGPEMNIQKDCSSIFLTKDKENNENDSVGLKISNVAKEATIYDDEMQLTAGLNKTIHESFVKCPEYRIKNVKRNISSIKPVIASNATNVEPEDMEMTAVSAKTDTVDIKPLEENHCVQNLGELYLDQLSDKSPALSNKLSADLAEQSIEKLLDGEIISKDVSRSVPVDGFIKQESVSPVTVNTEVFNLTQTSSILPVTDNIDTDREVRRKSLLKDLSQQLSLTKSLGKRKSTNFDLILGHKSKQSRGNSGPSNNIILNKLVSSNDTQQITSFDVNNSCLGNSRNFGILSHCETPVKSSQGSILLVQDILSPDYPSERRNSQDGLSPLPEIFCNTPTVAMGGIKCKLVDSLDDFDGAEMINNQEMPELANSVDDSFSENLSANNLQGTDIKQKLEFHFTGSTCLNDYLNCFGIKLTRNDTAKNVSYQHIPMSTVQDKLKALTTFVPKVEILKHFLADLECSSNKIQHECEVKLSEYTNHLPLACNWLTKNKPTVTQQILQMTEASKILALSKWKKHKADYLLKYFAATEAVHDALNSEIQDVLSETDSLIKNTSRIDARLHELDLILQDNKEQVKADIKLEAVEKQNVQLRVQFEDVNKKIETLQTEIEASQKRSSENVLAANVLKENLLWMNRCTEWSLLKKADDRLDFGFLWNTLVLHVHYSCSSKEILKVSLVPRLSDASQPWAKAALSYAVSSINCELLQLTYQNLNQLSQLLNEVSFVMLASRQLSSELKIIYLRHHLTIDRNSLTVVLLDRTKCRKLSMSTSIVPSSYPHEPFNWTLTSIFGCNFILDTVIKVIEGVNGGNNYLTRLMAAVCDSLKE